MNKYIRNKALSIISKKPEYVIDKNETKLLEVYVLVLKYGLDITLMLLQTDYCSIISSYAYKDIINSRIQRSLVAHWSTEVPLALVRSYTLPSGIETKSYKLIANYYSDTNFYWTINFIELSIIDIDICIYYKTMSSRELLCWLETINLPIDAVCKIIENY